MFAKIDITYTLEGEEPVTVSPKIGSFLAFEEEFNVGLTVFQDQKLSHMAWLAWETSRHNKLDVPATYEGFKDALEDLGVGAADDVPLNETQ